MELLPLEVVGLMITLLSLVIDSPPGSIQLIITELNSTPITVLTIHWIPCGLPTIAPCMEPDGIVVMIGVGTANSTSYLTYHTTYSIPHVIVVIHQ